MKSNIFFKKLGEYIGVFNRETIGLIYYGFVRMIIKELATKGEIHLPEFGKFKITEQKAKKMMILDRSIKFIPPVKTVRFVPSQKLKYYFKNK